MVGGVVLWHYTPHSLCGVVCVCVCVCVLVGSDAREHWEHRGTLGTYGNIGNITGIWWPHPDKQGEPPHRTPQSGSDAGAMLGRVATH